MYKINLRNNIYALGIASYVLFVVLSCKNGNIQSNDTSTVDSNKVTNKEPWILFKNEKLNFSMLVPKGEHSESDTIEDGVHSYTYHYEFKDDTSDDNHDMSEYSININEFPIEEATGAVDLVKGYYEDGNKRLIKRVSKEAKFIEETDVANNSLTGKEITFFEHKNLGIYAIRVYRYKNLIYTLSIHAFVADYDNKPSIKQFFNSFKLLKE